MKAARILLIRHGMTEGNRQRRYIGVTDEPLCREGEEQLTAIRLPFRPDMVFASPLARCIRTAQILFPEHAPVIIPELREMDFGVFENRCYSRDLEYDPRYRAWLDTRCEAPVPGGERKDAFTERCAEGFLRAMSLVPDAAGTEPASAALVVHGGTVMSVLSRYAQTKGEYYSWNPANGHGFSGMWDGVCIRDIQSF